MPSLQGGTLHARKSEIRDMRDALRAANVMMGDPGSGPLMLLLVALSDVIDRGERDAVTIQVKDDDADVHPSTEHDGFDQTQAVAEGWCIMLRSDGRLAIQKDDEQHKFYTDEAAEAFVRQRAGEDSTYHQAALDEVDGQVED